MAEYIECERLLVDKQRKKDEKGNEKMTDNEIIKALDHCKRPTGKHDCENCPYITSRGMCTTNMLNDTIDLINRQKEKNESLKVDLAKCSIRLDNLYKTADEIKSEAIKEFAGTVRRYIKSYCNPYGKPTLDYDTSVKIMHFIDNLVKEMTE